MRFSGRAREDQMAGGLGIGWGLREAECGGGGQRLKRGLGEVQRGRGLKVREAPGQVERGGLGGSGRPVEVEDVAESI